MKNTLGITFALSLISCIIYSSQHISPKIGECVSMEEQKKREADAKEYRAMVEALGGKHLEPHNKPQSQDKPENKTAKL